MLVHQRNGCAHVVRDVGGKQRIDVFKERRIVELFMQIALELSPRNGMLFALHVLREAGDDAIRIQQAAAQAQPQIEEVTSLPSLVQRAKFCSEQLIQLIASCCCLGG